MLRAWVVIYQCALKLRQYAVTEFSGGLRQRSTMFDFRTVYDHTDEHSTILWTRLSSFSATFWTGELGATNETVFGTCR